MSGPFGIVRGESSECYHANPAISSTQLMDMRPAPAFFKMVHIDKTVPKKSSDAFDVGTAAHLLILEGRAALEERTEMIPEVYHGKDGVKPWNWNANVCKDWRDARRGKVLLSGPELVTIERMAQAVEENPDAVALLTGGESEVTFRVQHPAFAVQCRADHWHAVDPRVTANTGPACVDLKTCDSIESFRREYFKFKYAYRAAFYREVIADACGLTEQPAFLWVALEKNAPWRCEVFEPAPEDLEVSRTEVLADLMTLRRCLERNEWPNSKPGIQTIALTEWQRRIAESNGAALFEEVRIA